ncbi:MAG: AI-2E family transporter [Treponema sp.]|nr:AI-2E family transporter [Treponema sp.]
MRNNVFKTFHSGQAVFFLMLFICFIFAAAVLKFASSVILPFTIAALLSSAMYPLVRIMDKIKVHRYISIFLVVIIIVTGLYVFGMVLFSSGKMVAAQYPKYESRLTEIYIWIANVFELPYNQDISFGANLWGQLGIRNWVRDFTFSFSNSVVSFVSDAVIVVLFVVFILLEANHFKDKLDTAFENRSERINKMGHDVMSQVTRYLTAKFLISLANGIIFAVSFYFVGLEFAFVWGVIQFLFNFIPNLGSIAAGVAISFFALLQFWPDPAPIIIIVSIILFVNLILCNIFDPKIIGDHVGISPLMILVSLAIWGWIWGFAGMVLAVPMTVIIKIVCENIPIMEPVSIILGSRKSVQVKKLEKEKQES